jgi:hypothetical protein
MRLRPVEVVLSEALSETLNDLRAIGHVYIGPLHTYEIKQYLAWHSFDPTPSRSLVDKKFILLQICLAAIIGLVAILIPSKYDLLKGALLVIFGLIILLLAIIVSIPLVRLLVIMVESLVTTGVEFSKRVTRAIIDIWYAILFGKASSELRQ